MRVIRFYFPAPAKQDRPPAQYTSPIPMQINTLDGQWVELETGDWVQVVEFLTSGDVQLMGQADDGQFVQFILSNDEYQTHFHAAQEGWLNYPPPHLSKPTGWLWED